jgi:hypothetical protein
VTAPTIDLRDHTAAFDAAGALTPRPEDSVKLHPRTLPVQRARIELDELVWKWMNAHDVTYVEAVRCLLEVTQTITKYQLREERHPGDPERKADEE